MMMDSEIRGPPSVSESQRESASGDVGRAEQGPAVASLRAAAGRVMATVAAKVQGAMPPSGKTGSASSFLGQDDGGSAGTLGSGYVTAGSDNLRDHPSSSGGQEAAEPGLFSPQQAQRLREMQNEAPLLYAGEENEPRPTSPSPPLPHSASSGSDQADAIQAEVKKQMQTFMRVQTELQQRVPVKSASIPLAIPEGWAMPTGLEVVHQAGGIQPATPIAPSAGDCWERVLQEARDWYNNQFDQRCDGDTLSTACGVQARTWKRWMTRLTDLGGASPDAALCVQALESITSNVLRSLPSLSFRINLARASLHLDTQPTTSKVGEYYEHLLVELEAVSRVSDVQPVTATGAKPEANKNVRQVEAKVQGANDANPGVKDPKGVKGGGVLASADSPKKLCKWFHEGKGCKRGKECRFLHDWNQIPKPDRAERCMACGAKGHRKDVCPNAPAGAVAKRDDGASSAKAAKVEGQAKAKGADPGLKKVLSEAAGVLRDVLSSQSASSDGNLQEIILAKAVSALSQEEPTALLDSGATHAVLDASSVHRRKCVADHTAIGEQALQLVKELEGARLQELSGRLRRVQAQLKVAGGMQFEEALDAFVTQGSYGTALAFARFMPFLGRVPERVTNRLLVDLQDAVGWEALKGLPFNRATRKKLHQSHAWLLHLGTNKVDPTLRQLCKAQHLELVVLDNSPDGTLEPGVWKALSWAAFTGRVAGILGDAPMRTWNSVKVDETSCIQLRSQEHLWGEPSNSEGMQARVDDDTVLGIQPMWLWTLASLAKGEGVPFCQTHALQSESRSSPWLEAVVSPFAEWSNSTEFEGPVQMTQTEEEPTSVKVVEAADAYLLSDPTRCMCAGIVQCHRPNVNGGASTLLLITFRSERHDKGAPAGEPQPPEAQAEVCGSPEQDDDAASEASWLRDQLEPTPAVKKVGEDDSSSQEEDDGSQVGWYEAPFVDEAECSGVEAAVEADDEPGVEGGVGLDVDPWEDVGGFGEMTDEKFDEALSEMLFSGANKVLRFAVPLKARKGPLILAGLQEIVTECNRLGYPVKVVHTDRAKELMSKATMDWLQSNLIQPSFTQGDDPNEVEWFGQKVIFKSKHPTGKSKRPFLRWEHAVYLCPTPRTEGGHVLLRASSSAYLVAKNVRCVEEMVDPEAEFGAEQVMEVDPPEPGFDHTQGSSPVVPSRRVTGKKAARSVKLAAEDYAETLLEGLLFSSDHCGRLLQLAFEGVGGGTRREHRGPIGFSVIFGAYSHGGLQGITRASRMYPMVCRYLNEYLRQCSPNQLAANEWSSLMIVVADEVAMHRDVRNEPGSLNHVTQLTTRLMWIEGTSPVLPELAQQDGKGRAAMMVRYARMTGDEWAELCQLEEEEFERRMGRWQRVLGGQDEDPNMNALSASIPHHLFMQTVFRQRNWNRNPEVIVPGAEGEPRLLARVLDFADDGPTEESPFPDRMLMFSVHDVIRDVVEMVILRVEARRPPQEEQRQEEIQPILQPPGPPPPEVRAVRTEVGRCNFPTGPAKLPVHLPNPTFIKVVPVQPVPVPEPEALACKTEATTTKDLESVLDRLQEPLSVTHTASQEEVRSNLEKWRSAIEKELGSLKKQGVLISHRGQEAKELIANPEMTVISLKGVFTAKAPGGPEDGLFKRKCRLVGCGNQATHVDADSLYAAGAPAEAVRVALTQAYHHKWSAFTTDIKSAFTQTPIPAHAAQRYLLRPPRWLGLAEQGEYYSLGMVLYGFKEAPAWWSDHRDAKLRKAVFAECHLEQGTADSSVWRIMKGTVLMGYLVTYVDDFLVLSDKNTAGALHQWLLSEAGWETDGLSEARPGHPVRFLGMQLQGHEDGHFSLDQEAYVDELIRAYKLSEANRSKIVCPREILMHAPETVQPFDDQTVKSAQKLAGECLWLAQRSRIDIAFATTVLCSKVSKDPHGAIAIGQRMMAYLHHTKDFKLHLKPTEGVAPLRVFTDASFAPLGQHSYGGHIIEVSGVPVLWKASKQPLISLSSSEAELI
ncbi:GIP [Symbiodinium necroappetens]|uniref:GIP protein n=1 Tax=Symbiodinium necroappetens TaxID=1628268 RepID=A0A812S8C6_9DINO|nr:GIP [Symbiodinium necroappetens]